MEISSKWRLKLEKLLEAKGFMSVVTNPEPTSETFQEYDDLAKSIVLNCIPVQHLDYIQGKSTAKEMIDAIEIAVQRKKVMQKLFHWKRLVSLKYDGTNKLEEHFDAFESIIVELDKASNSKIMGEDDKVCHLLMTLPPHFDEVPTMLKTLTAGVITTDLVKAILLDFEVKKGSVTATNTFKVEEPLSTAIFEEGGHFMAQSSQWNAVEVKVEYVEPDEQAEGQPSSPRNQSSMDGGWEDDELMHVKEEVESKKPVVKRLRDASEKSVICEICEKPLKSRAGLRFHMKRHRGQLDFEELLRNPPVKRNGTKQHSCKICKKNFKSNQWLKIHWKKHVKRGETQVVPGEVLDKVKMQTIKVKFPCGLCPKVFITSEGLSKHIMNRHTWEPALTEDPEPPQSAEPSETAQSEKKPSTSNKKEFHCNICKKVLRSNHSLRQHLKVHNIIKSYLCDFCGKGFNIKNALTIHMRVHTGERPYTCEICGRTYISMGLLNVHKKVHTGIRPYLCTICGKGWHSRRDLGVHMRSHTGERPYLCNICGKGFTVKGPLNVHMRLHQPIPCSVCGLTFPNKQQLKPHIKMMHPNMAVKPRPICSFCGKSFKKTNHLTNHLLVHSDNKPMYPCGFCDKSYTTKPNLEIHVKSHTGENLFSCEVCDKSFARKFCLKEHVMRSHVLENPPPRRKKNRGTGLRKAPIAFGYNFSQMPVAHDFFYQDGRN